jgi:hypothetical protein
MKDELRRARAARYGCDTQATPATPVEVPRAADPAVEAANDQAGIPFLGPPVHVEMTRCDSVPMTQQAMAFMEVIPALSLLAAIQMTIDINQHGGCGMGIEAWSGPAEQAIQIFNALHAKGLPALIPELPSVTPNGNNGKPYTWFQIAGGVAVAGAVLAAGAYGYKVHTKLVQASNVAGIVKGQAMGDATGYLRGTKNLASKVSHAKNVGRAQGFVVGNVTGATGMHLASGGLTPLPLPGLGPAAQAAAEGFDWVPHLSGNATAGFTNAASHDLLKGIGGYVRAIAQ